MSQISRTMDMSPFKLDIDDLVNEFAKNGSTTFAAMKKVWLARKFSYIFEASPSTNLGYFMQSLYSHAAGYMVGTASLSRRLAGLYCLYCLYETQPFKPSFKIYLSVRELKRVKDLLVDAKEEGIKVVHALVKNMLQKNVFLFGFVDLNEGAVNETLNQLTEVQNARVQLASEKLFANTRIEHFIHMDLDEEIGSDILKKMSREYAFAKRQAIEGASEVMNVDDIQHIADDTELIGDKIYQISKKLDDSREVFYQQTGRNHFSPLDEEQSTTHEQQNDEDGFDRELELLLSET